MHHFGLESFPNLLAPKPKFSFTAHQRRAAPPSPSFFYRGGTSRGRALEDGKEPSVGAGDGDGKSKRAAITEQTQAGSLPPGTKATAVLAPPGPKATAKTQPDYHNQQRAAYDATAPVLAQMVPEIGEQVAEIELSGCFRGALAMARGMVTGSRTNSSTSGASISASLLSQEHQLTHHRQLSEHQEHLGE